MYTSVRLTDEEIEHIKIALQYVYDRKMDIISQNKKILTVGTVAKIKKEANKYLDTQEIFNYI